MLTNQSGADGSGTRRKALVSGHLYDTDVIFVLRGREWSMFTVSLCGIDTVSLSLVSAVYDIACFL